MTPGPRSGFVYLLALVAVLVAATVAVAMASGAGLRLRAEDDAAARAQCRAAALGLLRAVVNDLTVSLAAGGLPGLVTVQPAGERIGACEVVLLGRDATGTAVRFDLIPEAARMDANAAPIAQLAGLPGMSTQIAAAIADWRDVDDVPERDGGAERSDTAYHAAPAPYAPRNAPLETLDELRLVRGIDDALWFGEDINRNGILDAGEDADGDGRLRPGLRDLLSLDNREPAIAPDGTARTSIRQAGALRARLVALFGQERGAALAILAQQAQPFANRLDLLAALGATDEEGARLWLHTTDGNRVGLIDAWSCREEVLTAAVGAATAAAIIGARPASRPAGPGWLARALGRSGAAAAGAVLTSGSWQFRADILAVRIDGAGWARIEATIDCSGGSPRVAGIRPCEHDGWPLPWATPETLRRHPAVRDLAAFLATGNP